MLFIRKHKPFEAIIREKFASPNPSTSEAIFGAWGAVDRALTFHGLQVTNGLAQTSIKKELTGNGKALKEDVERVVKQVLNLEEDLNDDEIDALAVILAYLKKDGLIESYNK